jgi:hypothetical protein
MNLKIAGVDLVLIADRPPQTSDLHFIHEYAERQAQLPRTGVRGSDSRWVVKRIVGKKTALSG